MNFKRLIIGVVVSLLLVTCLEKVFASDKLPAKGELIHYITDKGLECVVWRLQRFNSSPIQMSCNWSAYNSSKISPEKTQEVLDALMKAITGKVIAD